MSVVDSGTAQYSRGKCTVRPSLAERYALLQFKAAQALTTITGLNLPHNTSSTLVFAGGQSHTLVVA